MSADQDAGGDASPATLSRSGRSLSRKRLLVLTGLLLLGATGTSYGYRWWTGGRFIESTDDAYVGGDVTAISPHVSGFVAKIAVSDNQRVHVGQLLVRIAPADFDAEQASATATVQGEQGALESLGARIDLQHSTIRQAAADLSSRQATLAFALDDMRRYEDLARTRAGSERDAKMAETTVRTAQSAVAAAQAQLDASRQNLSVLAAAVQETRSALLQAQAKLRSAQLNVAYTEIRSPVDGYVGDRSAQLGAYVTVGSQLLSVVPAQGLWVTANFKEDQIRAMRRGQPATIVADVDPGRTYHGHLQSLAPATGAVFSIIPPQNATGNFTKIVQRVPVRIELDGNDGKLGLLRPGLSVTASVDTRPAAGAAP